MNARSDAQIICRASLAHLLQVTLRFVSTFLLVANACADDIISVLLPSEVASVCPGERLEFVCTTDLDYIQWNVSVVQPRPDSRESQLISNIFNISTTNSFQLNMIQFTVARNITAESGSHPLISTLSVANVTTSLNGTKVKCTTFSESMMSVSVSSATIHVIQPINSSNSSELETVEVNYYETNIIVKLGWTPDIGVSYNTVVDPQTSVIVTSQTGNITAQLTLDYNIPYKVSIVSTLCDQTTTTVVDHYQFVKCSYPSTSESRVIITPDSNLALEGTNITLSCPLGMELTGPTAATCMRNGEWEPDPGRVQCKELTSASTSTPPVLRLNAAAGIISSMTLLIIVFFMIGFVSGYFCHKFKQSHKPASSSEINQQNKPTPIYEEAVLSSDVTCTMQKERDLEMTTNVAYGPLTK